MGTHVSVTRTVRTFLWALLPLMFGPNTTLVAQTPARGQEAAWHADKELFVPMRDGIHLSTDVYRPKGAAGPLPTILIRTPYNRDRADAMSRLATWLEQGYALVVQNERGRFFSEGDYSTFLAGAATDGYDTIDWIVKQPWSNGKVGTIGCSSTGEQQWPLANSKHPSHTAMIPGASGAAIGSIPGNYTQGLFYRGGVPTFATWVWWYHDLGPGERLLLPANSTREQRLRLRYTYSLLPTKEGKVDLSNANRESMAAYMHLPSKDVLRHLGVALGPFDDFITWDGPADPRWKSVPLVSTGFSSKTPALLVNTWHDIGAMEMARMFSYLQEQNTPNQYLVVGAGPHCLYNRDETQFRDLTFGDLNVGDARYLNRDSGFNDLFSAWFAHFLKGEDNKVTDMPKVQLYIMGKGWVSGNRWPLENTRFTPYYLTGGTGTSRAGAAERLLSISAPSRAGDDTYLYDPSNPVPTRGGSCCGRDIAVDQRDVEARRDVLSYTTPVLERPLTVAGPVEVSLFVSSSAKDTDFHVKLVDVYPDGKAINLADDALRARYREGFSKKVWMRRGEVYEIRLSNMLTGAHFPAGHRIRLDVSSSNFPAYERNLNTGGNNFDETSWVVAENTIHYSRQYPSRVILPVIPD
jgi:putative CocE/NonD family hydrolase